MVKIVGIERDGWEKNYRPTRRGVWIRSDGRIKAKAPQRVRRRMSGRGGREGRNKMAADV